MYYSSSAVHIDTYIDLQDDCPIHVVTNSEGAEITVGGRRDNTFGLQATPAALDSLITALLGARDQVREARLEREMKLERERNPEPEPEPVD